MGNDFNFLTIKGKFFNATKAIKICFSPLWLLSQNPFLKSFLIYTLTSFPCAAYSYYHTACQFGRNSKASKIWIRYAVLTYNQAYSGIYLSYRAPVYTQGGIE